MSNNPFVELSTKLDRIESLLLSTNTSDASIQETMNLSEAAKLCQISNSNMYDLSRRGVIPSNRIGNRYVFIKTDLMEWLRDQ